MKKHSFANWFDKFSNKVTRVTGNPYTFLGAICVIIIWAISGPVFGYSDTWQLVINTGTTIITFLMVFVIQQSQNKDSIAVHLKLNELLSSANKASNFLIAVEDLTPEELAIIKKYYEKISNLSREKVEISETHSEQEAIRRVEEKLKKD